MKELRELRDRECLRLVLGCAAFKCCTGEMGTWWKEKKTTEIMAMKMCHGCSQSGTVVKAFLLEEWLQWAEDLQGWSWKWVNTPKLMLVEEFYHQRDFNTLENSSLQNNSQFPLVPWTSHEFLSPAATRWTKGTIYTEELWGFTKCSWDTMTLGGMSTESFRWNETPGKRMDLGKPLQLPEESSYKLKEVFNKAWQAQRLWFSSSISNSRSKTIWIWIFRWGGTTIDWI